MCSAINVIKRLEEASVPYTIKSVSSFQPAPARNLAVYKRPIGATVYFDGLTEKPQERDILSPSEKKILGKSALSIRMAAVNVYQRSSDRSFI